MALQKLQLSLQFGDIPYAARHRAALTRHFVARCIRHALSDDAEITVRIVSEAEGHALNHSYRRKDYATNVLTFDYAQAPVVIADIVLCAPVVAAEAKQQGKSYKRTMRICWSTGHCMRKAGTTKTTQKMRGKWNRMKSTYWRN